MTDEPTKGTPSKAAEVHTENGRKFVNIPNASGTGKHHYSTGKGESGQDNVILSSTNGTETDYVVINADGTGTVGHISNGQLTRADAIQMSPEQAQMARATAGSAMRNGIIDKEDTALNALREYIANQADGIKDVTPVDISLKVIGDVTAVSNSKGSGRGS